MVYIPLGMTFLLFLYSFLSRLGSRLKNSLYDKNILHSAEAPLPVISTGNISMGGTGKTPMAMALLDFFLKRNIKPALVSRGYRGTWEKRGGILSDGKHIRATWKESGDEPYMIAENFPQAGVFIGKNRLASCRAAHKLGFEAAVLDDGFQHRKLHRDIDILLVNPGERTDLRESPSAMKRADIILLREEAFRAPFPFSKESHVFTYTQKAEGFVDLDGRPVRRLPQRVTAFCGIARPERFLRLLHRLHVLPLEYWTYPDHFPYPSSALEKILERCRKNKTEAAVTTEKDAVKLRGRLTGWNIPVYYLKIRLNIQKEFYQKLEFFLSSRT